MAKILITGASGFVGSFLVKEALNRELDTYAGIRATSSRKLLTDERIRFAQIDFADRDAMIRLLKSENFDYIIQNAGLTRAANDRLYYTVNSEYTIDLANLALRHCPALQKFVFISSIESHGSADQTPSGVIDYNTIPSPRTTYGRSKLHAERALQKIEDLPLTILRPTAVFGPAEKDFFAIFESIKKYRFAPVVGSDDIKYSFIYVKDLARITISATLESIPNKHYFISDGKIYNIHQFTGAIAQAFGVKPFKVTIPYFVVETIAGLTYITDKITGRKSLVNAEQVAKMKAKNWDCDIAPLVNDLGFVPGYTLEEAIEETAQWYLKEGWL